MPWYYVTREQEFRWNMQGGLHILQYVTILKFKQDLGHWELPNLVKKLEILCSFWAEHWAVGGNWPIRCPILRKTWPINNIIDLNLYREWQKQKKHYLHNTTQCISSSSQLTYTRTNSDQFSLFAASLVGALSILFLL